MIDMKILSDELLNIRCEQEKDRKLLDELREHMIYMMKLEKVRLEASFDERNPASTYTLEKIEELYKRIQNLENRKETEE